MEIIEPVRRGLYGGAIGYIDPAGRMDLCLAIRTMVVHRGRVLLQAGAGVVADSDLKGDRYFAIYNPPLVNRRLGMRCYGLGLRTGVSRLRSIA